MPIVALLIAGLVIYLYFLLMSWFFTAVAPLLVFVGCIVLSAIVVINYVRAMGENLVWGPGWVDAPFGTQPAFRQYFFRKAFFDYRSIAERSYGLNRAVARKMFSVGRTFFVTEGLAILTWPLGLTAWCIVILAGVPAVVTYVVFGTVHLTVVALTAATAACLALFFRLVEGASMLWRRVFLACPSCYRKMALPVHFCPGCGAEHTSLIPGTYGAFRRRCTCGALLPTLFLFGRARLPSACPHCKRSMNLVLDARNIHIPVVGGPSAGKTSYLMASMVELDRQATAGAVSLKFPDVKNERLFEAARNSFQHGQILTKTAELSPDAFRVHLSDKSGHRSLLYVYDAAGELYQAGDELRSHAYYGYSHGILFLIDPFSLPEVRRRFKSEITAHGGEIKASAEPPQHVYDRMTAALREHQGAGGGNQPIAVVVTKADAFGIGRDLSGAGRAAAAKGQSDTDLESAAVKNWLNEAGEGNLVRCVEHDFKTVRFFSCTSLGRLPDSNEAAFAPGGVLDPLAWLLRPYSIRLESNPARKAA